MPSRDLSDACSLLRDAIPQLIDIYNGRYEMDGRRVRVGEVLRSQDEQAVKFAQGRTIPGKIVTNADGIRTLSSHQAALLHNEMCSHAVDMDVVSLDGRRYIDREQSYWPLIGLATAFRLLSGGDWPKPDLPHIACPFTRKA